ncbi:MAG: hypothetical protein J2P43_03655 [Candidatus Dormibacteraeota bacterium]|nr:hypothetical protein [Candidatus Dormibacteraeota bacterium]
MSPLRRARRRRALTRLLSPAPLALAAAAGLGAAAGLRSATPLAVLQLRRGLLPWPQGWFLVAGGAGELIVDKLPGAPNRTSPVGLLGRMTTGAWAGATVAGPVGACVAAASAVGAAFAGMHTRAFLVRGTGLPDGVFATAEDLVAVSLAAASSAAAGPR